VVLNYRIIGNPGEHNLQLNPLEAMRLAIEIAKKGTGFVSPNPLVGCVILSSDGELLAQGFHERIGEAHAEVQALAQIDDPEKLRGAHLYVTLEPCSHQGRTPACAVKLATLPIASVTYGLKDPNPLVSGQGAEILCKAGISVREMPELKDELEDLAEVFLTNMRSHRTFVTMKVAASLDGQIGLATGESQWITSAASREHVQYLRGAHDAVLVGANTFMRDNPRLNSRNTLFAEKEQKVVLVDPSGRTTERLIESELLKVRPMSSIFLVTRPGVKLSNHFDSIQHLEINEQDGILPWPLILAKLYENGIGSVFVEGGAYVYSQLLQASMVDRLFIYLAPKIIGAKGGLSWTQGLKIDQLNQALQLRRIHTRTFGPDVLFTGRFLAH
jgi:diaminohydroxyphosphoribosylaminopyrimidine deaminase/5-amino-6-(5-phosphoribosylamino)uracil reductase